MEYCEKTLRQLIDEKEVLHDYSLTWNYFQQILTGIKHIHSHKIKHRDIKPANIFITNRTIKIGDFGLAASLDKPHSDVGTPFYLAPEIVEKCLESNKNTLEPKIAENATVNYDEKCDIYSLGVVLFEIRGKFEKKSIQFFLGILVKICMNIMQIK
jgi:serine/threonine protein kinase